MVDGTNGLPDVDLTPILDDLQAQDKDRQTEIKTTDKGTEPDKEMDLAQFKNTKDLLKSYKEIQGYTTRVSQENKGLKDELAGLKEQIELSRPASQTYQPPQSNKSFDESFLENAEGAVDAMVTRRVMTTRIAEVLEEEAEKGKGEFQERYAYAQSVAREYPNLATTPGGVKKLFQLGDKLRTEHLKRNAGKALESIFGEPLSEEEITKLRTLVKGEKAKKTTNNTDAYMPDTSTSTRTGSTDDQKQTSEADIEKAAKAGDVDGVLRAKFAQLMAE